MQTKRLCLDSSYEPNKFGAGAAANFGLIVRMCNQKVSAKKFKLETEPCGVT